MDQKQIAKQMIDFNKTAFDNTYSAIIVMQDQTEKLVSSFLEKATWLPEQGKTSINQYLTTYKKGREDFKMSADENFKKMADFVTGS